MKIIDPIYRSTKGFVYANINRPVLIIINDKEIEGFIAGYWIGNNDYNCELKLQDVLIGFNSYNPRFWTAENHREKYKIDIILKEYPFYYYSNFKLL